MKRYRVQTRNYGVSVFDEEFTCGSHAIYLTENVANDKPFGVSKKTLWVSRRDLVHGHLGNINGGS